MHELATGAADRFGAAAGAGHGGRHRRAPGRRHEAWFAYTDNATPAVIMYYDGPGATPVRVGAGMGAGAGLGRGPAGAREQIAYTSADGTVVRMLVISADAAPDRPRRPCCTGTAASGSA